MVELHIDLEMRCQAGVAPRGRPRERPFTRAGQSTTGQHGPRMAPQRRRPRGATFVHARPPTWSSHMPACTTRRAPGQVLLESGQPGPPQPVQPGLRRAPLPYRIPGRANNGRATERNPRPPPGRRAPEASSRSYFVEYDMSAVTELKAGYDVCARRTCPGGARPTTFRRSRPHRPAPRRAKRMHAG